VEAEIDRVRAGRNAVVDEIHRLQQSITTMGPKEAPHELAALLDVHLMLLQDEELISGVKHWITERLYNAEWALTTQLEVIARQFDEMEDEYLRERKADLEQVVERILRYMKGVASPVAPPPPQRRVAPPAGPAAGRHSMDVPLVLVAHDLSPADMLQFKQSVFAGFVTDVGGKTSHTAIVARSMDIPAVVGARGASQLVRQDDWVIIDGDAGVMIVDPSPIILAEYGFKQRQGELERDPPGPAAPHARGHAGRPEGRTAGQHRAARGRPGRRERRRRGRGPVPQRIPVHGPPGQPARRGRAVPGLPRAVEGMQGLPVTIRTIDVGPTSRWTAASATRPPEPGPGPARHPLEPGRPGDVPDPAACHPACGGAWPGQHADPHAGPCQRNPHTVALVDFARAELDNKGMAYGPVKLGAMIEVPAAALMLKTFLKYFDFLSIGTNDLIQYTLAIDRADESVAHLYDPLHPAVLRLVADTIAECRAQGKGVSVCGEMAGDIQLTRLLLGLGLRSFFDAPGADPGRQAGGPSVAPGAMDEQLR
jgi:phosphotransferase system enzyme I (PtsI)